MGHDGYDLWAAKEYLWQPELWGVRNAWRQKPDLAFLVYKHHEPVADTRASKKRKVSIVEQHQHQEVEEKLLPDPKNFVAVIGVIELKKGGKNVAENQNDAENQLSGNHPR